MLLLEITQRDRRIFFFFFKMGRITACLFADRNDSVKSKELVMWVREGELLESCSCRQEGWDVAHEGRDRKSIILHPWDLGV